MKRRLIPIAVLASITFIYSCKSKPKETATETTSTTATTPAATPSSTSNEPKTYAVTFSPDTVLLGKNKEAFVKIKNAKAIALANPDGKDEGIELTFDLDVTNRNKVGSSGSNIFFRTDNFRLTLDNNNNITQDNGAAEGIDAESTKELKGIVYKIPAGAKPKMLNLFHEQTRVSIPVELK